jgi:hypothetical protein
MRARLRRLVDPGVPEPVDPHALRRMLSFVLVLDLLLVASNIG